MIKPLFRWAGGKHKCIKYLSPYLVQKPLYVEPFFGAGAIFCHIANNSLAKSFIINDIKPELMSLFEYIKKDYATLIDKCQKYEKKWLSYNKEERKKYYYDLRVEYWDKPNSPLLFFLLKTCFNGIWQTCKDSNGLFGTPCGLLTEKTQFIDIDNITKWSEVLQKTTIYTGDFEKLPKIKNALIYCDPPYRDSFTSYGESFTDDDQNRLLKWCEKQSLSNNLVVLSNKSDEVFFESQISNEKIHYFDATHTAGRRLQTKKEGEETTFSAKKVKEIIIVWN